MSDRPPGSDWWQDKDGTWHPPENRPAPSGRLPRPTDGRPLNPILAAGTQAVLLTSSVGAAFGAAAFASESSGFDAEAVRSAPDLNTALGTAGTVFGIWAMAALAGSILLIVWLYQSYRAALGREPTGTSWSPGWAIGSWFLPIANFVIPKLVANELDRITNPQCGPPPIGERWKGLPTLWSGHWWWALFIVSSIVLAGGFGVVVEQLDSFTLVERTYRAGLQATSVGLGLWAGAAVAGAAMVGRINRRLTDGATSRIWPPSAT